MAWRSSGTLNPWALAFCAARRRPAAVMGPVERSALALLAWFFLRLVAIFQVIQVAAQERVLQFQALAVDLAVYQHLVRHLKTGQGSGLERDELVKGSLVAQAFGVCRLRKRFNAEVLVSQHLFD